MKVIVVAGATGLVGSALMELLVKDVTVIRIFVLARRALEIQHPKVETLITDFVDLKGFKNKIKQANVLYCCIGTTIKTAGSEAAFHAVDYGIPLKLAALAQEAEIPKFIAISSLGADVESRNFYLRTKGEMERDIAANYKFKKLAFLRPSMLLGPRKEFRLAERVGQLVMVVFSGLMRGRFRKFRPIHDTSVAKSMISISSSLNNQRIYESSELEWLGK